MPLEDQAAANVELLIEHIDKFLEGIRTEEEFFAHLDVALGHISELFANLNSRGALTVEDVGAYQYSTCIVRVFLLTLRRSPKWDSDTLERQLKQNLRTALKGAPVRAVHKPS